MFDTYDYLAKRLTGRSLHTYNTNIDLGCGDFGFSEYCHDNFISSIGIDGNKRHKSTVIMDLNTPDLSKYDNVDFITLNSSIEHILYPRKLLTECFNALKDEGLIFIRTTNWNIDFKGFYNDYTHVKPFTPTTLSNLLTDTGFKILLLGPGYIKKPLWLYKIPFKYILAKYIQTKSVLIIGRKELK